MIIVEGPDGSGKSTLVKQLAQDLHWPIAGRVVTDKTERLVDLKAWTEDNLSKGLVPVIFDRHRLISDPIYRMVLPHKPPDPELYDREWLINATRKFYNIKPMIIYCLPPWQVVEHNILHGLDDNSVIAPHARKIYDSYVARAGIDLANRNALFYDYCLDMYTMLLGTIRRRFEWVRFNA